MANIQVHYYRFHKEKSVEPIPPSVIPYYDLTLVLEGALEYRVNNRPVTVSEGSVLLMPPGTKRERLGKTGHTAYVSYNFRTEEPVPLPLVLEDAVLEEIRMIVYACNALEHSYNEYAHAALEDMTSSILNVLRSYATRRQYSPLTEKILAYVHEKYRQPMTLKSIAGAMAYSVAHCDQVFKKDIGVSIVRYLIDYRISKVKEFLIENVISLQEIAERTGFGEGNYLSRQFRQRTGLSPLRFRKQFNR